MNVVRFVRVGKEPVYKRCLNRAANDIRADNRCDLVATVLARELRCPPSDWELRSRNHSRYGIKRVFLDLLQHVIRQWAASSLAHVSAEPRHDWVEGFGCPAKTAGKTCRDR